jgi:hypothetical protein
VVASIAAIHARMREEQDKIDRNLPRYQELVDALDPSPSAANGAKPGAAIPPPSHSNIQVRTALGVWAIQ